MGKNTFAAALPPEGLPRLLAIMAALRDPNGGCPWDLQQDFASIAPYTIEEAYEVADAIARADFAGLKGELGDLLFQSVYHAQMAAEAGHFTFADVVETVSAKMIDRHPHVFGDSAPPADAAAQTQAWEARKAKERGPSGVLDGVALGLPALTRAVKLQARAARVGFDWPDTQMVLDKFQEEWAELTEARAGQDPAALAEEFGDLLFVLANLARHWGIDAEAALQAANGKFTRRFAFIEKALAAQGKSPEASDLAEMDALWNAAKAAERNKS